ncbi:SNF2-related protein [Candidatus Allofournierella excrementigallinarum]|uniref:SNF2-related protein n=1 Tax=Candidatus Allofournierella excrementigallinarum TaxID=2838592 RepID=UPI00374E6504
MVDYTPYQARYFAEQITLKRPQSSYDSLASAMSGVKVDLNPHQVDAALFAVKSPLSAGALLADEVGLGKTIEAGLVLAQYWAERKRHILLIVPAALRTQWRSELKEKFYIDALIMESTSFNKLKKEGYFNPFDTKNQVVICSYNFAARKEDELRRVSWDLVIIDEAHRLRNVYKPDNVTGKKLKEALQGRKKLLLTATPLQNNLMELYGLVSLIDDHVFGDAKTFREMYVAVNNAELRNRNLRTRLGGFCKRTLRKQVTEYVRYTERHPILQEYTPTEAEEKLYNFISDYLQTDKLYALPEGQRTLITMVLRKLLASSSFAIAGTLNSLISRLEELLNGMETELDLQDYDSFDELSDEGDGAQEKCEMSEEDLQRNREGILRELAQLRQFAELASSIKTNAKGDNLIFALKQGFDKIEELGGQRKAVIFTESRRTQEYLFNLLTNNGYAGQIVFLNGMNNDDISKQIYADWKERHKNDGAISGSRQADMKAAVVEEFRNNACILIGTEAAAEGINLQFCSLVVNYDLPWNPQRIEQRIGRCHRYGQKNDVVVINFLNRKNAADCRVYELLSQKFRLFEGVFGSSDDVLGSIESGVDFEKRIANIYQTCKTAEEIQQQFDQLQAELSDKIQEKMVQARQSILENFDEVVASRLKECESNTVASLDKFTQWVYYFFMIHGAERVEPLEQWRLKFKDGDTERVYNLKWKDAEEEGDTFLRREDPLYESWLAEAMEQPLPPVKIRFDHTHSERNISFLNAHPHLQGILSIDKLSYEGIGEEEHLVFSVLTQDGTVMDEDTINSMLELPATVVSASARETEALQVARQQRLELQRQQVEESNKKYYLEECDKLDAYSEDLKEGLQRELKELKKAITEKKKMFRASTALPLSEMLAMKDEINKLELKRKKMQREIYDREDEIDAEKERLQEEVRRKLEGNCTTQNIMVIEFEVA